MSSSKAGPPEEIAPKLWRVPVPLPQFSGAEHAFVVNAYFVGGERWAMIDTGLTSPEAIAALEHGLSVAGLRWPDLEMVLITHYHPDHYGLSARIRELTGGEVMIHRRDVEFVFRSMFSRGGWERFIPMHGGPNVDMGSPMFSHVPGFDPAAPGAYLADEQVLDLGGRTLHVMHTPGHAPGHCCFALPEEDMILTGDHVLPKITPHVGYFPGGDEDPLGAYLSSLERIASTSFHLALPAHGDPFHDPASRARRIMRHHDFRMKAIADAIRARPMTAWDIVPELFGRDLPEMHYFAGFFEVLAHLEYGRRRSLVSMDDSTGKVLWRAAS
jgi:glyoxylase-like metal-dependent hydrolase (beta-lactamase superfamily II)